jgi:hypothetical protein
LAGSDRAGEALIERLQARRPELEQTVLARVNSVGDPSPVGDPEYALGLKAAVNAAVSYGLSAIEGGGSRAEPVPHELLAQARRAARSGVGLDTVLRRYVAGHALLGDYFLQAAEGDERLQGAPLQHLLRAEAVLFDRLVVAVTEEYAEEAKAQLHTSEHRRAGRVKRLLAGDLVEAPELGYELDAWHLAIVAAGPGMGDAIRELATSLDRRLLLVRPGGEVVWAWLGGRGKLAGADVIRLASSGSWSGPLALGEPAEGIAGWRLSHRQARAAMPIARGAASGAVCYGDVALLASTMQDDLLAASLRQLYVAPLAAGGDDGATMRETLHAYFAAGRNASSAAASLGVSRQTVSIRLRSAEGRIGRPLDRCGAELETALRLQELAPDAILRG